MTTSTVTPEIATFAQGVRAALADLPADEVDDLTDGLEADLAEAYAEDLQRELPDPSAYAAELRLAAGLPVRGRRPSRAALRHRRRTARHPRAIIGIAIRRNPALSAIAEFLVVLRPAWWVFRAWLATWLVAAFFGSEQGYWFDWSRLVLRPRRVRRDQRAVGTRTVALPTGSARCIAGRQCRGGACLLSRCCLPPIRRAATSTTAES